MIASVVEPEAKRGSRLLILALATAQPIPIKALIGTRVNLQYGGAKPTLDTGDVPGEI